MELQNSKERRKEYMRPAKKAFWWMTIKIPALSIVILLVYIELGLNKRVPLIVDDMIIATLEIIFCLAFPSLIIMGAYLLYCSGRSSVQRITLFEDVLVYSGYNGSGDNREHYSIYIKDVRCYIKNKRQYIAIGEFQKKESGRGGSGTWYSYKVRIPRTFEEDDLIEQFFKEHSKEGMRETKSRVAEVYNYL